MERAWPASSLFRAGTELIPVVALIFALPLVLLAPPAKAADIVGDTSLLGVSLGSSRSEIARKLSVGGYDLSGGTPIGFVDWYSPRHVDLNVLFLTQLDPSLGFTWGVSVGEKGEKYRISPGFWLGFVYRAEPSRRSSLTFSFLTLAGGDFRETPCLADYGDIGGIQPVNCRLAASVLPPAETLQFLVNERGNIETRLSVRYELRF